MATYEGKANIGDKRVYARLHVHNDVEPDIYSNICDRKGSGYIEGPMPDIERLVSEGLSDIVIEDDEGNSLKVLQGVQWREAEVMWDNEETGYVHGIVQLNWFLKEMDQNRWLDYIMIEQMFQKHHYQVRLETETGYKLTDADKRLPFEKFLGKYKIPQVSMEDSDWLFSQGWKDKLAHYYMTKDCFNYIKKLLNEGYVSFKDGKVLILKSVLDYPEAEFLEIPDAPKKTYSCLVCGEQTTTVSPSPFLPYSYPKCDECFENHRIPYRDLLNLLRNRGNNFSEAVAHWQEWWGKEDGYAERYWLPTIEFFGKNPDEVWAEAQKWQGYKQIRC